MDRETLTHVGGNLHDEEVGQDTGIGLATVYGMVGQKPGRAVGLRQTRAASSTFKVSPRRPRACRAAAEDRR